MKKGFLRSKLFIVLILILILIFGSYFCAVGRKDVLDDEARKAAPGSFVTLTHGIVHYELKGPASGETVVLVHGLTTPYFVWDRNSDVLVKAGFRVLRYDHYGRGFSDRPDVRYDRELYDGLLLELLRSLRIETPVHLVGLSMGGAIAVLFADRHPEMVSRVCLISPAGFPTRIPLLIKVAIAPVIGDYLLAVLGDAVIFSGTKRGFVKPEALTGYQEKFRVQMRYRGYKRSVLSTLRYMQMDKLSESYEHVGKQGRPVLLIWGRRDRVLPFSHSERVKETIPHVQFHAIDDGGHQSNYENYEIVNPILIRFLKGK